MAGVAQPRSSNSDEDEEIIRPETSNKRSRPDSDEWVKFDPSEECKNLDDGLKVVFVRGSFDNFPNDAQKKWDHPESPKSLCTQYLDWLFPDNLFEVTSSTYTKYIDLWKRGDRVYMFKAPGFFYFSNPEQLPDYTKFDRDDYDMDKCVKNGSHNATMLQLLAFYYTKILPSSLKRNVYIHKTQIAVPYFVDLIPFTIDLITRALWRFLTVTPRDSMGVVFVSYPEHAMVLIFDSVAKRLELYEPNGINAKYRITKGGPLQTFTMYDYLKTQVRMLKAQGIKRLWGNTFKFQQEDGSCSEWASAMAMCRMTGVSRDRLPTKTQDVLDIMSTTRRIIWNVCRFDQFSMYVILSFEEIDRALNACQVPADQSDALLNLVTKHVEYNPIPIPPDDSLTDEEMKDETCPRPLVINLQQVNVNSYFIEYIEQYCQPPGVVIVRGTSLVESSEAVSLIVPVAESVQLEMSEPINLSDIDSLNILKYLVRNGDRSKYRVTAKEAVAYDTVCTSRMDGRVKFDQVIVAKTISAEARTQLEQIADKLVDELRSRVMTLNIRNFNAIDNVLDHSPDSVDAIAFTGPLVGQEPHTLANGGRLGQLMSVSAAVDMPSANINAIAMACDKARQGRTLHVTEVGAYPIADDLGRAMALSKCIKTGVLSMDRLVLKLIAGANVIPDFAREFAKEQPSIPVYVILDPVDEPTLQTAQSLGVLNIIVDQKYESEKPDTLRVFLERAQSVEYRKLCAQ